MMCTAAYLEYFLRGTSETSAFFSDMPARFSARRASSSDPLSAAFPTEPDNETSPALIAYGGYSSEVCPRRLAIPVQIAGRPTPEAGGHPLRRTFRLSQRMLLGCWARTSDTGERGSSVMLPPLVMSGTCSAERTRQVV